MNATDSTESTATPPASGSRALIAWGVHIFTASGAVWGLLALFAIMQGRLGSAVLFMLVSLGIDSIDGSLARKASVQHYAPGIDGRRMDDIVDYLNFVIVPCVFMVAAGNVTSPYWVALPVLASAFGFSQKEAKTADDFFLGWPSYWNVLAFYLWLLELTPWVGTLWVIGLSIAVFIPYKYIYPSQLKNKPLRNFIGVTGILWAFVIAWAALNRDTASAYFVTEASLLFPALYMGLSFKLGGLHRG